jgi:hypothetical protein
MQYIVTCRTRLRVGNYPLQVWDLIWLEGIETERNLSLNFLRHFLYDLFPMQVFTVKIQSTKPYSILMSKTIYVTLCFTRWFPHIRLDYTV